MQINELYFGYTPYTKYVNEEEISLPKFKEAISKPENNLIKDITDFLSKYDEKYNKEDFGENDDIIALQHAAEQHAAELQHAAEEGEQAVKTTIETFDGMVR